ncbi:MAG: Rossmann-like and DUF2520 domain-containing protein [Bacteroidia bacterium]
MQYNSTQGCENRIHYLWAMISPSDSNIAVIGAGNLAWSLIPALNQAGFFVSTLISRSSEKVNFYTKSLKIPVGHTDLTAIPPEVNIVFLTTGDQALPQIAHQLAAIISTDVIVIHTSGSTPLEVLSPLGENIGVLYPLQSFKAQITKSFLQIPVFAEGSETVLTTILPLAQSLSETVQVMDSQSRLRLHLGAVLVNNFTNCLYRLSQEINPTVDFSVYQALIMGHLENVFSLGPAQSQTGPAIRSDMITIEKHLQLLHDQPEIANLYRQFSTIIQPGLRSRL